MLYPHHHPYTSLLTTLHSHLPYSGPLLRRIQYQVTHPSSTACILATFPPSTKPESESESVSGSEPEKDTPWLAAYIDIHRRPETQVWLYSSLETRAAEPSHAQDHAMGRFPTSFPTEGNIERDRAITKRQLRSLFGFIRRELVPAYLEVVSSRASSSSPAVFSDEEMAEEKDGEEGERKKGRVTPIPPHPVTSFLLGSIHIGVLGLISELSVESRAYQSQKENANEKAKDEEEEEGKLRILRGQDVYYAKYTFPSSSFFLPSHLENQSGNGAKENEFHFHDSNNIPGIQEIHVDLVRSRTHIPRSRESLLSMGSVALYHAPPRPSSSSGMGEKVDKHGDEKGKEMPIAWAFLGFDGSLCTLHVEPEFRGRGLGVLVGREVMRRGCEVFNTGSGSGSDNREGKREDEWFFADVAVDNSASRRVMEKMGGVVGWTVAWAVVEYVL